MEFIKATTIIVIVIVVIIVATIIILQIIKFIGPFVFAITSTFINYSMTYPIMFVRLRLVIKYYEQLL